MNYLIVLLVFFFGITLDVYAGTSKNGIAINENESENDNTFSLYCSYSGHYYILIDRASTDDNGNIESNTGLIEEASDATLKKYSFMDSEGNLDCPKYVVVDRKTSSVINFTNDLINDTTKFHYSLNKEESSCTGKCTNNQTNIEKPKFNCFYLSQNSDKKIDVSRDEDEGKVYITFPDGTKEATSYPLTETCQDFYFNTKTKQIKIARYDYLGNITDLQTYDPAMYKFICGSSRENQKEVEYFCAEGCNYPNNAKIDCKDVSDTINKGNIDLEEMCNISGVKNTLRFFGYLLLIVKILVPVLLIVLGVIDFSKALLSSNNDSLQKAASSLLMRIIAGVAIFLIPTIVNFIFKSIISNGTNYYNDCRVCIFEPNHCD